LAESRDAERRLAMPRELDALLPERMANSTPLISQNGMTVL